MINDTSVIPGRFGNILIINILCSHLAKKYNLKMNYKWLEQSNALGLQLFSDGSRIFNNNIVFEDDDFERFIEHEELHSNIILRKHHQTPSCAHQIMKYIKTPEIRKTIIDSNCFNERYGNNNDVYVHVRLDDTIGFNPGYQYYDGVLSNISFENGFISSDTITHPICEKLIQKYNLIIVDFADELNIYGEKHDPSQNEILTIMFASTCKYIVCSGGSFSWIIGVLSSVIGENGNNIYYHASNRNSPWFGDIFVFDNWNMIDTN